MGAVLVTMIDRSLVKLFPQESARVILTVCIPISVKPTGLIVSRLGLVRVTPALVTPEGSVGSERVAITEPPSGSL